MKILFYIDSLRSGGKERRLIELLKRLKNYSSDIEFEIVLMSKDVHYKEIFSLNTKIHYIIRKTKKDLSAFHKFYTICKIYRPDIVHCWNSMTVIYSIPACKLLGIKLINGMVVDTPVRRNISNKYWLRAKLTFPFSSMIIGNSYSGLDAYNAPDNKSICIYNGMDMKRFENLKSPSIIRKEIFGEVADDLFIAGMVAAFEDRKDYGTLIKSAISLVTRNENLRFILVGDGANFNKIKNSIPSLLSNKIIFLGRRSDVESIGNVFDVGILLTDTKFHGEGISNSIIEYMALGKPVIATHGGGTSELIINDMNGFLLDHHNDQQLTEKVELLMNRKQIKEEMGSVGRQMAIDKFDIKVMTNHYIESYHKLLKIK